MMFENPENIKIPNDRFGFVITRHINSEKTNEYWNFNVMLIRKFYINMPIIIICDNSQIKFLKKKHNFQNVYIIKSQFPGRGELLPYYYLIKYKFLKNAFILHDSVFFNQKINFDCLIKDNIKVLPSWYFNADAEDVANRQRIANALKNNGSIQIDISGPSILTMKNYEWAGCFGVQAFINLEFLISLENKYKISNLVNVIKCRKDRQSLERIFGFLFFREYLSTQQSALKRKSLLGNIMNYQKWGYTFDNYLRDFKNNRLRNKPLIKIWTGR
jgi:hypothetical protein